MLVAVSSLSWLRSQVKNKAAVSPSFPPPALFLSLSLPLAPSLFLKASTTNIHWRYNPAEAHNGVSHRIHRSSETQWKYESYSDFTSSTFRNKYAKHFILASWDGPQEKVEFTRLHKASFVRHCLVALNTEIWPKQQPRKPVASGVRGHLTE